MKPADKLMKLEKDHPKRNNPVTENKHGLFLIISGY